MPGDKTTKEVETFHFTASTEDDGERIDVVLARHVPGLSRRRARVLLGAGSVHVDGRRVGVLSRRVRAGAEVVCHDNPFAAAVSQALDASRVLYEDEAFVAIDKPADVPSHPTLARRQGTALQLLEEHLRRREGRKVALWPVHRLDAGTSGILLFAKTRAAARSLGERFARREVRKRYLAVVRGHPSPAEGEVRLPLAEGPLRAEADPLGREARTRYRTLATSPGAALLEIEPETGRMHQIRVHLAAIGHPIRGDRKYGGPPAPRLCLHASALELAHPEGGRPWRIECAARFECAEPVQHEKA